MPLVFRRSHLSPIHLAGLAGLTIMVLLAGARPAAAEGSTRELGPSSWEFIGPGNVTGRIDAVAPVPGRQATVYVGAAAGGVWKTVDNGATWTKLTLAGDPAISGLAVDPTSVETVYAATGGLLNANTGLPGAGIFKTIDGGATWTQLASTANGAFTFVNRIVVDPGNGGIVMVTTPGGILRSTDGGESWTPVLSGWAFDLSFHPGAPMFVTASGSGEGWFSVDEGQSWAPSSGLPATLGKIQLSHSRGMTVFASASGRVFVSEDAGQSYAQANMTDLGFLGISDYANALSVSFADTAVVLVGGEHGLARSTNRGVSWTSMGSGLPPAIHAIVPYQEGNSGVWIATDHGLFRNDNLLTAGPSQPFTPVPGIHVTQIVGGCALPVSPLAFAGGVGIGTVKLFAGNPDSTSSVTGDGGYGGPCAVDPVPDASGATTLYGVEPAQPPLAGWRVFRAKISFDGAITSVTHFTGLVDANDGNFAAVPPLALDPHDSRLLYVGIGGISRLANAHTAAANAPWTRMHDRRPDAFAVGHGDPVKMLAVTIGGDVIVTDDALANPPTWQTVFVDGFGSRFMFDDHDENVAYLALGAQVVRSLDGGHTWSGLAAPPNASIRAFSMNPRNGNELFLGTDRGLFTSVDRGASWSTVNQAPDATPITAMFWEEHTLHIATWGNGIYRTLIDEPSTATLTSPKEGTVFTAGDTITLTAQASDPDGTVEAVEYFVNDTTKVGEASSPPYTVQWKNVPAGSFTVKVLPHDGDFKGIPSAPVHITIKSGVATADAYVQDGTNASKTFGTSSSLQVRTTTSTSSRRDAYLRFDISGFKTVSSATLSLVAKTSDNTNITVAAYDVSDSTWKESSITWKTKPARSSTVLASVAIKGKSDAKYTLNLTSYVKSRLAAGVKVINIALHNPSNSNGYIIAHAREASSGKPALIIRP